MVTIADDTKTATALAVGSRVRTNYSSQRDADSSTEDWGVIVEDFAPTLGDVSRDWAVAHRWAVALDNGCLVFRDSDEVRLE